MPCDSTLQPGQSLEERMAEVDQALRDLRQALLSGSVTVGIGPNGAVSFENWGERDRRGLSDACVYRALSAEGSWELRQAVMRAETMSGRRVNPQAVAAGWHTHDRGKTWQRH